MSDRIVRYEFQSITQEIFEVAIKQLEHIAKNTFEQNAMVQVTVPAPVNLLEWYSDKLDEGDFLRKSEAITSARFHHAKISTLVRFNQILESYFLGIEYFNVHMMITSARAMVEILAVYSHLISNMERLAGTHKERGDKFESFQARVLEAEIHLVKYTHGTRSEKLAQIIETLKPELSRVMPEDAIDTNLMKSGNILNKISKLSKRDGYIGWEEDYNMLSGYLHPSAEQAGIYEFLSETSEASLEIVTKDVRTRGKGLDITLKIMNNAAVKMYELLVATTAPFGDGEWIDFSLAKFCISCGVALTSHQSIERGVCIECNKPNEACYSCGKKLTNRVAKERGICYSCSESGFRV